MFSFLSKIFGQSEATKGISRENNNINNSLRTRKLKLESLEERALLSIAPVDTEAVKMLFPDL